jgi:hypothetical protein
MEEIFDLLLRRLGRRDLAEVQPELLATKSDVRGGAYRHPVKPIPPPYAMLACKPG